MLLEYDHHTMTLLLFIAFNFLLFLSIRGLLVVYKLLKNKDFLIDKLEIYNTPLFVFFPIFSLFLIGNISILSNFFLPLSDMYIFWTFFICLLIILNFKERVSIENKSYFIISFLVITIILDVSSYGLKLHFDSVDYHLNFQYWIRESTTVFGLSNLYVAYGWSTIYEYILANFWTKDNFLFLHFINLIFFTFFYNFLAFNILFSKNNFLKVLSFSIAIYSFLDNFGVNGGGNGFLTIQMVGKPDLAVGILFFISFILFLDDFLKKNYHFNNFLVICTLSLFAFQIKIVSVYLVIPLLIYSYKLDKKNINLSQIGFFVSLITFTIIYILKNIAISGCLIFPIGSTCLDNLSWNNKQRISEFSDAVISGNYGIKIGDNLLLWFESWINNSYNIQVYTNMVISFLIVWIINLVFFKKSSYSVGLNQKISYFFIFLLIVGFFISGPTVRYGFGTFLIAFSVFSINRNIFRFKENVNKLSIIMGIVLLISIGLTPRLYSYKAFFQSPFEIAQIEDSTEEYLNSAFLKDLDENFVKNSICYIPKTCVKNIEYKNITYSTKYGYKLYSMK